LAIGGGKTSNLCIWNDWPVRSYVEDLSSNNRASRPRKCIRKRHKPDLIMVRINAPITPRRCKVSLRKFVSVSDLRLDTRMARSPAAMSCGLNLSDMFCAPRDSARKNVTQIRRCRRLYIEYACPTNWSLRFHLAGLQLDSENAGLVSDSFDNWQSIAKINLEDYCQLRLHAKKQAVTNLLSGISSQIHCNSGSTSANSGWLSAYIFKRIRIQLEAQTRDG
jgi:hypothetical protein